MSHRALAICDRCGLRYKHMELSREWTGNLVCKRCYEDKHPQLEPEYGDLSDPKPLVDPRPEQPIQSSDNTNFDTRYPQTAGTRS